MMNWQTLLYFIGAGLFVWMAFRLVKNNPQAFSKKNLSKSVTTIAYLTLLMIIIVAFCVLLLRNS